MLEVRNPLKTRAKSKEGLMAHATAAPRSHAATTTPDSLSTPLLGPETLNHALRFDIFWRAHPEVGRYLPHIIEAYITCPRVVRNGPVDLEDARVHVFGSTPTAHDACDRCQAVYTRLKDYLDKKISR